MPPEFVWHRSLLLLAGFPEERDEDVSPEHMLEIEEALLSFARAAFARGHRVIVPADRIAAPLLAMVAAEYRRGPLSEAVEEEPPALGVAVLGEAGTRPEEIFGRVLPDGVEVGVFGSFDELVAATEPSQVFVIGGSPSFGGWASVLRARERPTHSIGPTLTPAAREAGFWEWESAGGILDAAEWPGTEARERPGEIPAAEAHIPYAYVMQRLLERGDELGAPIESEDIRRVH